MAGQIIQSEAEKRRIAAANQATAAKGGAPPVPAANKPQPVGAFTYDDPNYANSPAAQPLTPEQQAEHDRMLAARPVAMLGGAAGAGAGIGSASAAQNVVTSEMVADMQARARAQAEEQYSKLGAHPVTPQAAAGNASAALGPAPQVDMGLADRGVGRLDESINANKSVLDQALHGPDLTQARSVLDQLLNGPNTAERIGQQTLKTQLALARSAAGGPGAVADALMNAQAQAPELQAQAAQSATAETMQRTEAAGNLATSIGNIQNNATSTAGQVAGQITNAELGKRQQDIGVAQANQSAAVTVLQEVSRLTGTQLELDQRNQELIGQMARDMAAQSFNWASLGVQAQDAYFSRMVQVYGIDKNFEAQIKQIAAGKSIGPLDVFNGIVGVVGGAASVATAAIGKK